jgi:hypothetical protein
MGSTSIEFVDKTIRKLTCLANDELQKKNELLCYAKRVTIVQRILGQFASATAHFSLSYLGR